MPEDLAEEADIYFNHPFGEKPLRFCALFLKWYKREQDRDISEASDVLVLPNQILLSRYETRPFVRQNAGQKSSRAYACHGAEALNLELQPTSSRLQAALLHPSFMARLKNTFLHTTYSPVPAQTFSLPLSVSLFARLLA